MKINDSKEVANSLPLSNDDDNKDNSNYINNNIIINVIIIISSLLSLQSGNSSLQNNCT